MKTTSILLSIIALFITACNASEINQRLPLSTNTTTISEPILDPTLDKNLIVTPTFIDDLDDQPPGNAIQQFSTNFEIHSVSYRDILSGGPPKDGIPAIDDPKYSTIKEADMWIADNEPVILLKIDNMARAYPLQILTWHEIVNDQLNGVPVVVSFCPLCNTAIVYSRTMNGEILDFGTTGRLRYSNLIMYDRQHETWWQQATGEAIVGDLTGSHLQALPAFIISWQDYKNQFPTGDVLSKETGFQRSYGTNPYSGYDDVNNAPFLYDGPQTPGLLPPVARVLAVEINGESVAYPYTILENKPVINDTIGDTSVVVFWTKGTASALDNFEISKSRDVGAAVIYESLIDGETLIFSMIDGKIIDLETESSWNFFGEAVSGPMQGKSLRPIIAINHFWFSWAAFRPDTQIYNP